MPWSSGIGLNVGWAPSRRSWPPRRSTSTRWDVTTRPLLGPSTARTLPRAHLGDRRHRIARRRSAGRVRGGHCPRRALPDGCRLDVPPDGRLAGRRRRRPNMLVDTGDVVHLRGAYCRPCGHPPRSLSQPYDEPRSRICAAQRCPARALSSVAIAAVFGCRRAHRRGRPRPSRRPTRCETGADRSKPSSRPTKQATGRQRTTSSSAPTTAKAPTPSDPDAGAIGSADETGGKRSDTIMILRVDHDAERVVLAVSLPRDL